MEVGGLFGDLASGPGSVCVAPKIVCSHRPGATLMITCYRVVILHRALMMSLESDRIGWDRMG